ncbi:hypothetical protein [Mesorhizobium sp. SP-1A]|uniref:hypothetical protein n=1 Tax=Mesorhizobium sp. SP-1A TaxID=3077840 RepID=UPI0028F6F72D|nr:hypothetical protein [Mesorhizobium sp. SP-1A]
MKKGQPNSWQRSAQWREISRAAIRRWNAKRASLPKCGARRKRDGEPCLNLAMANGKCRCHGGRTPRGDQYRQIQWPNGSAPDAERKLAAKLKRAERNRRAKERRLAAMTPEKRAAHEKWQRDHKPGPAADRVRRRANLKAAAEFRAISERADARPLSPELLALQAERERIEAERDRVLRQIENNKPVGVFG